MRQFLAAHQRRVSLPEQLASVAWRYSTPLARTASSTGTLALPVLPDTLCQKDWLDNPLTRIEAILFLAKEPLPSRKLSRYANLADGTEARTLVSQLNQRYDEGGSPLRVEQVGGGYQLLTRSHLAPWLRRLRHLPRETRLSSPALETLAVVAYRQPIPRAEVEAIRGVSCGEILRQLLEQDLVRVGGRSEELGRPYLYVTTRKFLLLFGLKNLEHLPRADEWGRQASRGVTMASIGSGDGPSTSADQQELHVEEEADVTITSIIELQTVHPLSSTPQSKRGEGPVHAPFGIARDPVRARGEEEDEAEEEELDEEEDEEYDDDYEDDDEEEFEDDDEFDDDDEELDDEDLEEEDLEEDDLEEDDEFDDDDDDEEDDEDDDFDDEFEDDDEDDDEEDDEEWDEVDADDDEDDEEWDDDDWDEDDEDDWE